MKSRTHSFRLSRSKITPSRRGLKPSTPKHTGGQQKSEATTEPSSETKDNVMTATGLILRAKHHIGIGETSRNSAFRDAAEDIACAFTLEKHLTQRGVGKKIGKSAAWVNRLLQWRKDGYVGAPFADKIVQGVNSKADAAPPTSIEPSPPAVSCEINAGSEVARDACQAKERIAEANAAEGDASQKQAVAEKFSSDERTLLVQNLEFLATERPRLRAQFATNVETRRARLGLTWDQLLVSADAVTPSLDLNLEHNETVGREGRSSDMPDIPLSLRRTNPKVTRDQADAAWRSCRDLMLSLEPEDRQWLSADVIEPFLAAHRLPVEVYKADASHKLRGDAHGS